MQQTASLYDFTVTWEPFLLRPGIPLEGVEKPSQYKTISKTGNLYQAGQSVGIDFTGKCQKFPNTIVGHAMLQYCKTVDSSMSIQNQVQEYIFQAYFTDGVYPDRNLLDQVAQKMGFDMVKYKSYMDDQSNIDSAEQEAMQWRSKVQTGVPFFIINGKPAFSGAQDVNTFVGVFKSLSSKI